MREEPGEAEGGAAAERRGSEAQGRKREQKKVRETEPGGGEVRLARGGPGPDGSVSGCARLGTSVFMVWVWLLTEANKKGRRKGNMSYFLQQKCEPRFLFLKMRPQKCCPSVLRRQQHPGFRGCVDSRANGGFLWNTMTSGFI